MAYPISNDVLQLFKSGALQKVQMTVNAQNSTYTLTNADLKENTLIIDRATVSGQAIEIGSTIASELSFVLDNYDGRFNNYIFEGADIAVSVGVTNSSGATTYVPMGYFTVDTQPRRLKEISIYALDRMMQFDKPVAPVTYPITVAALLRNICTACNVTLYTVPENLPNGTYTISAAPESEDLTYRQLLQWIAQITGTCAYFDWNGNLRLEWYSSTSAATITTADRFTSDLYESPIEITGVQVNVGETSYLSGEGVYALLIEGNELIQDNPRNVANALASALTSFTYTPFSCETLPLPHLYPLDCITFVDSQGVSHSTIITNAAFSLNGRTILQGSGETATLAGYASANPLTNREQVIIKNIANQAANATLGTFEQATLELNETIAGSMGLYTTVITNEDGSKTTYFHSKPELTESVAGDVIYTWLAGGFAYTTTGWNNGSPVWQYGFTADGNSVLKVLTAYGINADWINAGAITIKDAEGNTTFSADTQTGAVNINGTNGDVTFTNTPINLSASQTYLASNYTTADTDRVREIILGNITPTQADYEKYDFYGDGQITNVDLVLTRNLALGLYDSYTVSWHFLADPSDKTNIIKVWRESKTDGQASPSTEDILSAGAAGINTMVLSETLGDGVLYSDGGQVTGSGIAADNLSFADLELTHSNAGAHNCQYRGKYLGTSVTSEQWDAIESGQFTGLYIGDYWTIGGRNYRIAAFDYYYNTGDTAFTQHHAVIVPDTSLYTYAMNDNATTSGGYAGSKMRTEGLEQAKTIVKAAFPNHVLSHRIYLTNAVTNGSPSNVGWYDSEVDLMNEQMVYGGPIHMSFATGNMNNANSRIEKSQLPLFVYEPNRGCNRSSWWLRDVASVAFFSVVGYAGRSGCDNANQTYGVRPAFCIG